MNARDELVQIIWDGAVDDRVKNGFDLRNKPIVRPKVEALADAILAAGYRKPRTITTAEELDALPNGSVIREYDGFSRYKYRTGRWLLCVPGAHSQETSDHIDLPATVLHEGV